MVKTFISLILLLTVVPTVMAATGELDVSACSGTTSCSVSEYNSDDTGVAHTIGKNEVGVTDSWTNFPGSTQATLSNVFFTLRHDGDNGISNGWTITVRNEAASTTYCTDNTIAHVTSDTTDTWNFTGDCGWTIARLNDLEIAFASGDAQGPTDAFITYANIDVTYNDIPSVGTGLADDVDLVSVGDDVNYTITATDPDTDNYRLTVCRTDSITDGYPGTCDTGETLCTSTATSSGSQASCVRTTNASDEADPLTVYGFVCDEGTSNCNLTASSTTTTVNPVLGYLNVSFLLPEASITNLTINALFNISARITCSGAAGAKCGSIQATARYNGSSANPDTSINTSQGGTPFFIASGGSGATVQQNVVADLGDGVTDGSASIVGDTSSTPLRGIIGFQPVEDMYIKNISFEIGNTLGADYLGAGDVPIYVCDYNTDICSYSNCQLLNDSWDPEWVSQTVTLNTNTVLAEGGQNHSIYFNTSFSDDATTDLLAISFDNSPSGLWKAEENPTCSGSAFYGNLTVEGVDSIVNNPETSPETLELGESWTVNWTVNFTGYVQSTYYFDGGDGISDPDNNWDDDANAADGSTSTLASVNFAVSGDEDTGYLQINSTTAPTNGGTINSVQARAYCRAGVTSEFIRIYTDDLSETLGTITVCPSTVAYTGYIDLSTPTGGWSWTKINNLESKSWEIAGDFELGKIELLVNHQIDNTSYLIDVLFNSTTYPTIEGNHTVDKTVQNTTGAAGADISFTIGYPATGCSNGAGCSTGGCSACTYMYVETTDVVGYAEELCVEPSGQNTTVSFKVFTNTGDVSIDLTENLNQTIGATLELRYGNESGNCSAETAGNMTTIQQTIVGSLATSGQEEIWYWGNFLNATAGNTNRSVASTSQES